MIVYLRIPLQQLARVVFTPARRAVATGLNV